MFYLGLYLENKKLKAAAIYAKKNRIFLEDFYDIELSGDDVKPLYIIPDKYHGEASIIASGLSAEKVLLREKDLAIASKKHLKAAIPFQLEEMVPYNSEEALISINTFANNPAITTLQVLATKKVYAQEATGEFKKWGFEVDFLGNEYNALVNCTNFLHNPKKLKAIFFISKEKLVFALSQENHIYLTYSAYFDEKIKNGDEKAFFQEALSKHLQRLSAYIEENNLIADKEMLLCVFSSKPYVQKIVSEILAIPLSGKKEEEQKLSSFCFPIGFALQSYAKEKNFLIQDLTPAKLLSQRQRKFFHALSCIGLSFILLFGSRFVYAYLKEQELSKRLSNLNSIPYTNYNLEEIKEELFLAQKKIRQEKEEFSYLFTYPTVSDALAWLSTHPILSKIDEKTSQRSDVYHVKYQVGQKNGKIEEVVLEAFINFPNESSLKDFLKSLEKDTFLDKNKPYTLKQTNLNCSFSFRLQNQVRGEL